MKEIMKHSVSILLVGLLLIKISAFHVYDHHDTEDPPGNQCELCILILDGQPSEALYTPALAISELR